MRKTIDAAAGGLAPDLPAPWPEDGVWTEARNIRFREGAAEKIKGYIDVFGSASATPIWIEPVSDGTTTWWVYGNETTLYATDGSAHANVSPTAPTLTFAATTKLGYTGGAFHGRMVVNDGANPPHVWSPGLANDFTSLSHWPASTLCQVLRPFGDFLFGLRWTESGVYNPRIVRWSDRAAVGAMPQSWDFTDPTNQAGRTELGQTLDELVDCLPLRDQLVIYKRFHTWIAQYVGGDDVFGFREVFKEAGLLTEHCVKAFGPRHFVVTDSDIIVHDGNDARSLLDKRMRRWLFSRLDTQRYEYSFVAADHRDREMWFCFPERGRDYPNLAAVWSWLDDAWSVRDLGEQMAHGSSGIVLGTGTPFDADPGTFDGGGSGQFDEINFTPYSQRLVLAPALRPAICQGNTGDTFRGSPIRASAMRQAMALSRDPSAIKRVLRIWPRLVGAYGTRLRLYLGVSDTEDGPVRVRGPYDMRIGIDRKIDVRATGRYVHLQLEHAEAGAVRLLGFDVEFEHVGRR